MSKRNGNWGIEDARVLTERDKPNAESSIVRTRVIWTRDGQKFLDIRHWYNNNGDEGYPNQGKGAWLPMDKEVLLGVREAIDACLEYYVDHT